LLLLHLSICFVPLRCIPHPIVAITNLQIHGMCVCVCDRCAYVLILCWYFNYRWDFCLLGYWWLRPITTAHQYQHIMWSSQWHSTSSAIQCCWRGSQPSSHTQTIIQIRMLTFLETLIFQQTQCYEINSILHPLKGSVCDCRNLSIKLKEMKAYTQ
jgi:hypothetical protein